MLSHTLLLPECIRFRVRVRVRAAAEPVTIRLGYSPHTLNRPASNGYSASVVPSEGRLERV